MNNETRELTSIEESFKEHLLEHSNNRILFSSKFGTGKTYFLKNFFEKQDLKFVTVHLFPCKYLIGNSRDILRMIKYDVLMELSRIKKGEEQCSQVDFVKFILNDFAEDFKNISISAAVIAKSILTDIPYLGKAFTKETMEEVLKATGGDADKDIEDSPIIDLASFNFIREAIEATLLSIKKKIDVPEEVKSVLVIDDLDRLDPPSIFKIFNIFGSLLNPDDKSNLLGFDKIIFVCDLNNIENIHHHQYGEHSDFEGYIEKFFSNSRYEFNNEESLSHYIEEEINHSKIISQLPEALNFWERYNVGKDFNTKKYIMNTLVLILQILNTKNNMITYRKITKPYLFNIGIDKCMISGEQGKFLLPLLYVFEALKVIFGDTKSLIKRVALVKNSLGENIHDEIRNDYDTKFWFVSQMTVLGNFDNDFHDLRFREDVVIPDFRDVTKFTHGYSEEINLLIGSNEAIYNIMEYFYSALITWDNEY